MEIKGRKAPTTRYSTSCEKYLNNIIDQDHRFIKKRIRNMRGLKSYKTARKMIDGIEAMYMIKKGQTSQGAKSAQKISKANPSSI